MNRLLTAQEVSKMLGISKDTILRYAREDYIPHIRVGGAARFESEAVENWEKKRERPKGGPRRIYI